MLLVVQNTIQIATFGETQEGIVGGIRNFPIHKLALLCYEDEKGKAEEFARKLRSILGIPISFMTVSRNNVIRDVMERVGQIMRESQDSEQVLMNVSAGDKMLGCAAVSASFINGIKAFGMDHEGCPMLLPVLKLSYAEVISHAKIAILQAIEKAGGSVKSLEELSKVSGYSKPLLSYHVQGGNGSRGLADLDLVEVERAERGKIEVRLTTLGKLLIVNDIMKLKP